MKKGELKFVLDGERLKGEFHMVKIKPREGERGDPWLLFKSKDALRRQGRSGRAQRHQRRFRAHD